MANYVVIDKSTGAEVYRYHADAPIEWAGMEFQTHDHVGYATDSQDEPALPKFAGRRLLTKLEFRGLFPEAAIKAIDRFEAQFEQASFLTDEQKDTIRTGFNDYHAAENVNLDDPRWVTGLGLYVSLGMITAAEVSEVLNG